MRPFEYGTGIYIGLPQSTWRIRPNDILYDFDGAYTLWADNTSAGKRKMISITAFFF